MVSTISIAGQELVDSSGQTSAYIVSADEMEKLRAEVESLREQVARLEKQRDGYAEKLTVVLQTFAPPAPTEAQWREARADPLGHVGLLERLGAES